MAEIDIEIDGIYCPKCKCLHPTLFWHEKYCNYLDKEKWIENHQKTIQKFRNLYDGDIDFNLAYKQELASKNLLLSNVEGNCVICGCKTIFVHSKTDNFVCSDECKCIDKK